VNILYLGSNQGTAGHRKEAMVRLGHQVHVIDPASLFPASRFIGQWRRHTGGLGLVEIVRKRVLRSLEEAKFDLPSFDLAWVDHGDLISARLVDDLKARISRVVCYNVDDPFGRRDRMLWREFLKAVPRYDLLVVVRACNIEEAYQRGAKAVMCVFRSADEVAHAPRQLTASEREEWASEVVFVGTAFPERGPFLAQLVKLGVPVSLYGNRYSRMPQWPLLKPHWRSANTDTLEGYANAICAAKVCLGLLSKGNRDLHTQRSLEIPSLGGVLCAEKTVEHLALYEEDREAVFWDTPEECAAKCFALLADDSWRQAVAAAGRRRYLKNPWRNMQVIETVLKAAAPPFLTPDLPVESGGIAEAPELHGKLHYQAGNPPSPIYVNPSSRP
jgi:spore maturation protein CgeB